MPSGFAHWTLSHEIPAPFALTKILHRACVCGESPPNKDAHEISQETRGPAGNWGRFSVQGV